MRQPDAVGGVGSGRGALYETNDKGTNGANDVLGLDPTTGNVLWTGALKPLTGATTVGGVHWQSPSVAHGAV